MKPDLDLDGVLRAVHGGVADTAPAPDRTAETTGPVEAVVVPLPGRRATGGDVARQNARATVRAGRARLAEWKRKEGTIAHGLMAAKPRSYAEQAQYAESREWATKGHEGDVADLLHTEFHNLIGKPGTVIGLTIAALSQHPVACAFGFLFTLSAVEGLLAWAGQITAVVWIPVVLTAIFAANYFIVAGIAAHDREQRSQSPSTRSDR